MSAYPVQDFIYKHFPITCVAYAKREYGYTWRSLLADWKAAKTQKGTRCTILGNPVTAPQAFFSILADRQFNESEMYACVNGCCTVIWHPKRGNTGGMGMPGCPCDDMADPRDLTRGPIARR